MSNWIVLLFGVEKESKFYLLIRGCKRLLRLSWLILLCVYENKKTNSSHPTVKCLTFISLSRSFELNFLFSFESTSARQPVKERELNQIGGGFNPIKYSRELTEYCSKNADVIFPPSSEHLLKEVYKSLSSLSLGISVLTHFERSNRNSPQLPRHFYVNTLQDFKRPASLTKIISRKVRTEDFLSPSSDVSKKLTSEFFVALQRKKIVYWLREKFSRRSPSSL